MKAVFIGSSGNALRYARAVSRYLQSIGVNALPWWEQFPPGTVTIEALEEVMQRCSGAVLLATPDDLRVSGDGSQHVSRDNVILELGMFTARLGRRNVALLRYDDVVLPTDLTGFTHVKMGAFDPQKDVRSISPAARAQLETWAAGLQDCNGIARTRVLHGYSGRWHVEVRFTRWWDLEVREPDYVLMEGQADLVVPAQGSGGHGLYVAQIDARISQPASFMRIRSVQTLEQVSCDENGRLSLVNSIFNREIVEQSGTPPGAGGFQLKAEGPSRYATEAFPLAGNPGVLTGVTRLTVGERLLGYGEMRLEHLG